MGQKTLGEYISLAESEEDYDNEEGCITIIRTLYT
jgi:hypothetical protein